MIGAGPAGCAAATCAAEQGANVFLIESSAMAGGMSTAARVPMFMPAAAGTRLLCEGYGRRILTGLRAMSAEIGYDCGSKINAEHLRFLYEELLESAGVKLLYYTTLAAAVTDHILSFGLGGWCPVDLRRADRAYRKPLYGSDLPANPRVSAGR